MLVRPCRPLLCPEFPSGKEAGGRTRMIPRRLGDGARLARSGTFAPRHERRHSSQMGKLAGAPGGLSTYPMVRRADPRVGRALRPSDAGRAHAGRPCLPFPRSFIPRRAVERETEAPKDCKPRSGAILT